MTIGYDNLPEVFDPPAPDFGRTWESASGDEIIPVRRPIGFIRRKPCIRVKAWTMPIIDVA